MLSVMFICESLWLPQSEDSDPDEIFGPPATTYIMAQWIYRNLADIINRVDNRTKKNAIQTESVTVDFHQISSLAINPHATYRSSVQILVYVPEIDQTYQQRKSRRQAIAELVKSELENNLISECDHLLIPEWEIEVVSGESSGFTLYPDLNTTIKW